MFNEVSATIGVAICTFGDKSWARKAVSHAAPSVVAQTRLPDEFVILHGETLASTRNKAVKMLNTEWVVLLDADDQLEQEYLSQIPVNTECDILAPFVKYVNSDGEGDARRLPPSSTIINDNWIVVGAPFRRHTFLQAYGFRELPGLEDWDLWIRMTEIGAEISSFNGVYIAYMNPNGRNKSFDSYSVRMQILNDHKVRTGQK